MRWGQIGYWNTGSIGASGVSGSFAGNSSFIGLSTGTKPTLSSEARATWHSVDTGEVWVHNDGMWVLDINGRKLTDSVY